MPENVEFIGEGGVRLRGRLFLPEQAGPAPVVVLQPGMGDLARMCWPLAPWFTAAGLGVLGYDHRNFGHSDGEPRLDVDPWLQAQDLRHVLTALEGRDDVDGGRIGLWGMSIGAVNCLHAAAFDWRVGAVVAIAPPVSGLALRSSLYTGDARVDLLRRLHDDRLARAKGEAAARIPLAAPGGSAEIAGFRDDRVLATVTHLAEIVPGYRNEITLSSLDKVIATEVAAHAPRITAPTMLALTDADELCLLDDARAMFDALPGVKEKHEYPGTHHDALTTHLPAIGAQAVEFLGKHLAADPGDREQRIAGWLG
ncbi:alpha/beta hydrolase [Amycolatopsis sp. WQ 127309]|uniref:alpha/beta hydrolase n=1 Tax=Amycolatopsis sp. WQ 127309 TaxID=2932773 RepID=UPI001FF30502|nr:alpha/beta fold hydrolase [Amycolatopsis sp. WQ 127309]UOZ07014.1 alpha/beta fold hydrolase [Amycolatopsis sp. WQ 127309]